MEVSPRCRSAFIECGGSNCAKIYEVPQLMKPNWLQRSGRDLLQTDLNFGRARLSPARRVGGDFGPWRAEDRRALPRRRVAQLTVRAVTLAAVLVLTQLCLAH